MLVKHIQSHSDTNCNTANVQKNIQFLLPTFLITSLLKAKTGLLGLYILIKHIIQVPFGFKFHISFRFCCS